LVESVTAGTVPAIECHEVEKHFGQLQALRGASLKIYSGEILALLGDNGAGKSTLVKCIAGAQKPDGGTIAFRGEVVEMDSTRDAQDRGIQTIYQDLALSPDLRVLENMYLGREVLKPGLLGLLGVLDREAMQRETETSLRQLGIRVKSPRSPVRDLSGGQRQAVAVARAMRWADNTILMDEPTAALGARQREIVYRTARAAADRGLAVVMISHDIPQMLTLADRIAVMRQGVVVAQQPTAELDQRRVMDLMLGGSDAQ
jgi:simple sugar transport system ATP-binding protein